DAGVALHRPMPGAEGLRRLEEVPSGDLSRPVPLGGALQLARRAEGGKAEVVGACHRVRNLIVYSGGYASAGHSPSSIALPARFRGASRARPGMACLSGGADPGG